MGPRARRRAAGAAIGVGVVAAVAAAIVLTRHSARPGAAHASGSGVYVLRWPVTEKLSYGLTEPQVRARAGAPTKTVRDETGLVCWQYPVHKRYRANDTLDAVRVCFFGGRYTIAHYEWNGAWDYHPRKIHV